MATPSLSFVAYLDLFQAPTSSCAFPLGEGEESKVVLASRYFSAVQDAIAAFLLKSKGLCAGSFSRALFQVCLGHLPGVGSEV